MNRGEFDLNAIGFENTFRDIYEQQMQKKFKQNNYILVEKNKVAL